MNNIKIQELSKYYGKNRIIDNINLEVNEYESFGLIGPSKNEKSTLIKILLNFIYPTKGTSMIMGMNSVNDSVKIKSLISYMPSDIKLNGRKKAKTLIENVIGFYRRKKNDFKEEIERLSEYLKLNIEMNICNMSKAELRKLWVIFSLINKPLMVFLDNPTDDLDLSMKIKVIELYKEYKSKGNSFFISTDDLECITSLCDRISIMKKGKLVLSLDLNHLLVNDNTTIKNIILEKYNKVVYCDEPFYKPN